MHADASTTVQSVLAAAVQQERQAAAAWALSTGTHQRADAVELVTAFRAARRAEGEEAREAGERACVPGEYELSVEAGAGAQLTRKLTVTGQQAVVVPFPAFDMNTSS